jgi:Transposase IS116/IS110/IS902 family
VGERIVGLVLADHHAMFAEGLGIILSVEEDLAVLRVAHTTRRAPPGAWHRRGGGAHQGRGRPVQDDPGRAVRGRAGAGGHVPRRGGDIGRFPSKHHFAAHTGTAPLEASSGQVVRHRLSRAGDRKLNHALYLMAMVQVRRPNAGQAYYRRKLAEGKSPKEALR